MAKYSFEFKKKVVLAYLNGEGGYKYLSKIYGVPSRSNIERWVHNYQTFGDDGKNHPQSPKTVPIKRPSLIYRNAKSYIYVLAKAF